MKRGLWIVLLLLLVLLSGIRSQCAAAESVNTFYAKNTVTVVVGRDAGGGIDLAARIFASFWPQFTGGGTIMVKNVPGAAGVVGANQVYAAKPDGLTLGLDMACQPYLGAAPLAYPGARFDAQKMTAVGMIPDAPYTFSISTLLPYKTLEEVRNAEGLKLAGETAESMPSLASALTIELLKLKNAKLVLGYKGSQDQVLAAARGEVSGFVYPTSTMVDEAKKGFLRPPLLVIDVKRTEYMPTLPTAAELDLTPADRKLLTTFASFTEGRAIFGPPGIPEDRVRFLREAFNKITAQKAFQDQYKLRFAWITPVDGKNLTALVKHIADTPKEDIAALLRLPKKYSR